MIVSRLSPPKAETAGAGVADAPNAGSGRGLGDADGLEGRDSVRDKAVAVDRTRSWAVSQLESRPSSRAIAWWRSLCARRRSIGPLSRRWLELPPRSRPGRPDRLPIRLIDRGGALRRLCPEGLCKRIRAIRPHTLTENHARTRQSYGATGRVPLTLPPAAAKAPGLERRPHRTALPNDSTERGARSAGRYPRRVARSARRGRSLRDLPSASRQCLGMGVPVRRALS